MKKIFLYFSGILVLFLIFALKPIDTSKENAIQTFGTIKSISEGGTNDLVFELEGNNQTFYINRGLDTNFTLENIKKLYLGKKAEIFYVKNWTPLAPFGTSSKHISQISVENKIIYSEF